MGDENKKLEQENSDAEKLVGRLQSKYETLKKSFVKYMIEQKKLNSRKFAQKLLTVENAKGKNTQILPSVLNAEEQ
jgi:molecular chaperone GrpE (heat shock protein)